MPRPGVQPAANNRFLAVRQLGMTDRLAGHQEMPGFFVLSIFGIFEVRGEDDGGLVVGGEDGKDVPSVGGDDEGGEEVELVGAVEDVARANGADVGVLALVEGAFDLDTAEESVVVGGDIVGGGFSPGLGDAESALGGALHETEFGPLSAEFGVLDVFAVVGHWSLGETVLGAILECWLGAGNRCAGGLEAGSSR